MATRILFEEKQKFTQKWLWLILLGVNFLFFYAFLSQVFFDRPLGNNPVSDTGLGIIMAVSLLLTLIFLSFRLDTKVQENGIYVRFFPIHLNFRHFSWEDIKSAKLRKYSAITEYGGWGIRYGFGKSGKAYNISGNSGLQLELKNGQKLLIGTQHPETVEAILNSRFQPDYS
jgi:hypothetical protein